MRFLVLQWAIRPHPRPLSRTAGRGANLKQVYRVVMWSEAGIAHIFCPLLNRLSVGFFAFRHVLPPHPPTPFSHTARRVSPGALMPA